MTRSLACLLAGVTTMATPVLAADPVTFQLDWLPGGDKAPIYVCIDQGFCEEAGIEVTIAPGRGSTDAISRLAAGTSDVGVSDIGALMAARAQEGVGVTAMLVISAVICVFGMFLWWDIAKDQVSSPTRGISKWAGQNFGGIEAKGE